MRDPAGIEALEPRCLLTVAFQANWATLPDTPQVSPGASAQVADMNGDGRADVVMAWTESSRMLSVFLGGPSGEFTRVAAVFAGSPGIVRALGDFDGDGDIDAVVDSSLFLNNGVGILIQQPVDPALNNSGSLSAIDVNGDGQSELALQHAGVLRILRLGLGGFATISTLATDETLSLEGERSVVDLNGDGRPDLVLRSGSATRLVFNSAGGLLSGPLLAGAATLADGTGDRIADRFTLAIRGDSGLDILRENGAGDGSFAPPIVVGSLPAGFTNPVLSTLTADFNRDGRPDLLLISASSVNFESVEAVISDASGRYDNGSAATGMGTFAGIGGSALFGAADLDGDNRPDAWGFRRVSDVNTEFVVSRQISGAAVTRLSASSASVEPHDLLVLTATITRGELPPSTIPYIEFYIDLDGDGVITSADSLLGMVGSPDGDGSYRLRYTHTRTDLAGPTAILAVAKAGATSAPGATTVTFWQRTFYPEGFRNDASVNEYVSIVNPSARAVTYQLIARYETGVRDQIIAEGVIPANARGGVTICERGRPEVGLTRPGVGYALELRADGLLGATFAHYDSFTGDTPDPIAGASGESLSSTANVLWSFADVSTSTFDFLLFYNPGLTDAAVQVRFYDEAQGDVVKQVSVSSLRRGGLAIRDIAELLPNTRYAVTVSSSFPLAAAHSRYRQDGASWGTRGVAGAGAQVFAGVELRPTAVHDLSLFNTGTETVEVTLESSFDTGAVSTRSVFVPPRQRLTFDPFASAPIGAAFGSLRLSGLIGEGGVVGALSTQDFSRGDLVSTGPTGIAARGWAFGDAFLAQATAGISEFETLVVYNPSQGPLDITVTYHFLDGSVSSRVLSVAARSPAGVRLHEESVITDFGPLVWYGISLSAPSPVVATMTHWDLSQGGGWATIGGVMGSFVEV
ncbi:MAG: VCBS repeat-containing protein [Phycisphaerae bacterium]|nr:VCBS repeat-containing protein [Phycisphaerae bacterium]